MRHSAAYAPARDTLGTRNQNPAGRTLLQLWREDLEANDYEWYAPGFWALAVHRFGNWRMGVKTRLLRAPLSALYNVAHVWVIWMCGIDLCYSTRLGRRVRIWHHGGIVLSACEIGDDVHIRHNTTLGVVRRGDRADAKPRIEDRVDIGVGAVILGPITIGHDSVIGANAVVLEDVPRYSVAVGVPARVVKSLCPKERPCPESVLS